MTNFKKISTLLASIAVLSLSGYAVTSAADPAKLEDDAPVRSLTGDELGFPGPAKLEDGAQSQPAMKRGDKKMDHKGMKSSHMGMDMSKVDMSKISTECQAVLKKMNDHDMKNTEGHDMEKMKAKKAKHKECMAEMKEAMSHEH